MLGLSRRRQPDLNHWPGFVDALATLLMVIIFLLMIFVIGQVYLGAALSGRDEALDRLTRQIDELNDLLDLERASGAGMASELSSLTAELAAVTRARDDLSVELTDIATELATAQIERQEALDAAALSRREAAAALSALNELRARASETDAELAEWRRRAADAAGGDGRRRTGHGSGHRAPGGRGRAGRAQSRPDDRRGAQCPHRRGPARDRGARKRAGGGGTRPVRR